MRRKDRENNDGEFFELVFTRAATVNVAFRDEPYPYCQTFNFAKIGANLYIHCAREGRKLDLIRRHPEVGFALAVDVRVDQEKFTTYYKSVCGEGLATLVEDVPEKARALEAIGLKYDALCPRPATMKEVERVAIVKIAIVSLSGKEHRP